MEITIETRRAFKETFVILKELGFYQRIPQKLQELIDKNKDDSYEFTFDRNSSSEVKTVI